MLSYLSFSKINLYLECPLKFKFRYIDQIRTDGVSSALVLLMLPGLALFYGGMVRKKNVLSTMMHVFAAMGVIGVQWIVIGYTLAFGPGGGSFVGGLGKMFLHGVGPDALSGTIPELVFVMF